MMIGKTEKPQNTIVMLIVAVLIDLKLISHVLKSFLNSEDGFFATAMMVCYVLFTLVFAYDMIQSKLKVNAFKFSVAILYTLLLVVFYALSVKVTETNWLQLFSFAIIPTLIFLHIKTLDIERMLCFVMLISTLLLPATSYVLILDWRNSLNMEVAYAFLPGVVAAIVHFQFYRKDTHKTIYLLYAVQTYYGITLLRYGVRGPIVCIMVAVLLSIYCGPRRKKAPLAGLVVGSTLVLCLVFLENIVQGLANMGLDWYFIRKSVSLLSTGNVLHGRESFTSVAMRGFWSSPIWGKGLNSFHYYTGRIYPHNIIVQLLFEGGLILFGLFSTLFTVAVNKLFKSKNANDMIAFVFLTPVCFVYYLMSSNVWRSPLFWIYVGFLFYVVGKNSVAKSDAIASGSQTGR